MSRLSDGGGDGEQLIGYLSSSRSVEMTMSKANWSKSTGEGRAAVASRLEGEALFI